jgi:hypothetical protein
MPEVAFKIQSFKIHEAKIYLIKLERQTNLQFELEISIFVP